MASMNRSGTDEAISGRGSMKNTGKQGRDYPVSQGEAGSVQPVTTTEVRTDQQLEEHLL